VFIIYDSLFYDNDIRSNTWIVKLNRDDRCKVR